jgi:hypothetical protein
MSILASVGGPECRLIPKTGWDASDTQPDPGPAHVDVEWRRNGTCDRDPGVATDWIGEGCKASDIGDQFEVSMTITLGDSPDTGPTLAPNWHTLNTTRNWGWDQTGEGDKTATYSLAIREIANTSNSVTWTGDVEAIVEAP